MFYLESFAFPEMIELGSALQEAGRGAANMQEVANLLVRCLYDSLLSKETGQKACVLVRLFKTQRYGELSEDLQLFARNLLGGAQAAPEMKCLVLLATAGLWPEWNAPGCSKGHQAIPLPSEEVIAKLPMISQLLGQMGVKTNALLAGDPDLMLDLEENSLGVFHVPQAQGSPHVPAQEFVVRNGVKSVLGFGGPLTSGDVFSVILFSNTHIPRQTAGLFKTLGLIMRLAINPFARHAVGAAVGGAPHGGVRS